MYKMDEAKLKQLLEEAFQKQNPDDLDKLTGLLRGSEKEFDAALSDSQADISVALADIDMFSRINDTYGHDFGDEVIKEIAKVFTGIDASKEVYRCGGEEFLVFFEGMSKEDAFLIMEQARKSISGEACLKASATFSAGIATYPEDGANWTEIKRKADGALYRAKTAGRNKICLAKEEKLVTKTAHYTIEQLKRLEKLAGEKNMSEASLMREALDELLKKYNT